MPDLDKTNPKFDNWLQDISTHPIAVIDGLGLMAMTALLSYLAKKVADILPAPINNGLSRMTLIGIKGLSPISFSLRYKQQLIVGHSLFQAKSLHAPGTLALVGAPLQANLKTAAFQPQQRHHKPLPGNRPIWAFLQDNAKALVVIGEPGCGKSTLLQQIALTFACNRQRAHHVGAQMPILLCLRDHADSIVTKDMALAQLAQAHFGNENHYPGLKPPAHWFAKQLVQGKAIVLLDGLDEIADEGIRQQVSAWIDRQIGNYRACPFIVTANPHGYLGAPLQQAYCLQIEPFDRWQVREFVYRWYAQNTPLDTHNKEAGEAISKRQAEALLSHLQRLPELAALTANPLLLTMIAIVHRQHGQLPGQRVQLYANLCEVLLGYGAQDGLDSAQKRAVLEPLAAAMMQGHQREISQAQALSLIAQALSLAIGSQPPALDSPFLQDIEANCGLLHENNNQCWSFAHLTLQEYLTACHWLRQPPEQDWHTLVGQSAWHETLRLYSAQTNASAIVRACLQQDTLSSLTLANACAEVALALDEPIAQALRAVLAENLESADTGLRQLAANALLTSRLNNLQALDGHTEIATELISCAEYQLFLDETGGHPQPAHWQHPHFPQGMATQAVLGVRAADAQAFCLWLSQKTGENYRLPSMAEAQHLLAHPPRRAYASWCRNPGHYALAWQTPDDKNGYLRQLADLHPLPVLFGFELAQKPADRAAPSLYLTGYFYSLDLDFAFDADFDPTHVPALERLLDLNPERPPSNRHNRALTHTLAHAFEHARSLDHTLDLGYILNLEFIADTRPAITCIPHLKKAIGLLELSPSASAPHLTRLFKGLLASLESPQADDTSIRRAARKILLLELETLLTTRWVVFCENLNSLMAQQQQLLFWRRPPAIDTGLLKDTLLAWFWAYKTLEAREEGSLPAWEGIRIVRERK